jgi:3-hydroxybutyryl-CoA dehydrogenase/5-formyl-3-hydroxy-2-methylpyridine 4-carboxylate dehydrogenase
MTVTAFDPVAEQRQRAADGFRLATGVLGNLGVPDRGGGAEIRVYDSLAQAVEGADLVVETVPEKLDVKVQVFGEIDKLVGKACVLASNTSGIPITKLQAGNSAPGRVVGMHWSNPPHIIPMIEVIAGNETAPETVTWMCDAIKGLGLLPVVVQKDVPGFVENRILYAIMRESVDLVEKGIIDAEGLDTCVSWGIGYKLAVIGPMALLDMAGLDIYQAVGSYLNKDLCNRPDVAGYVTSRTAAGKLGMKTGGGIFSYTPEKIAALRQERARKFVTVRKALDG